MPDTRRSLPPHVAWLGYGGLLPFVGLAVLTVADPPRASAWFAALVRYGAVILGFVGALHWGFAMCLPALAPSRRRRAFAWSVVPALLAWVATLLPGPWAPLVLVPGFALQLRQDRQLARTADLAPWYLPLRWQLTAVACACLLIGTWRAAGPLVVA